jgi:GT2 family glycosyltransferase
MNTLAPIVLFVYNRPDHTRKTLESLMRNTLADRSELIIYADGPKQHATAAEVDTILNVRKIIRAYKWCKEVHITEATTNKGLARSIIEGVTETVNRFGKVIVLEDDLVLSVGFLQYMNDALDMYQEEDKVMHISGYMFPIRAKLPETFFYNSTSCWGWGTWARAWKYFNPNASELYKSILLQGKENIFNARFPSSIEHLKANIDGKLNTWAIKWHAVVFLNNGFCLHPARSLVQNIGNDSTGVNSITSNVFFHKEIAASVHVQKIKIAESAESCKAMEEFYYQLNKVSLINKIRNVSYRFINPSVRERLKKIIRISNSTI